MKTRRLVPLIVAFAVVACSGSNVADSVPVPHGVDLSATDVVTAPDVDRRPPTGGPRPDADTSVLAATATSPFTVESASVEVEFVNATNWARRQVGAQELVRDSTLDAYARDHAQQMAARGSIYHSDIKTLLGVWWFVGENVGEGPNAGVIQLAYYASPGHFRNMTHETFTHFGVGVYLDAANRVWTVQDFAA